MRANVSFEGSFLHALAVTFPVANSGVVIFSRPLHRFLEYTGLNMADQERVNLVHRKKVETGLFLFSVL